MQAALKDDSSIVSVTDSARGKSLIAEGMIPPQAFHWARTSAEHRALLLQTYHGASEQLKKLSAGLAPGSWAVAMDVDETILDNTPYFQEQAQIGLLDFSFQSWIDFVNRATTPLLPGALQFTKLVYDLGGRVVVVTNRAEYLCNSTRKNLDQVGIRNEAVLCRPPVGNDKTPRFRAIEAGAIEGLPPLRIVMYVGDNITDFPNATQEKMRGARDAEYSEFGRTWWMLPNPIYGSWQSNPIPPLPAPPVR